MRNGLFAQAAGFHAHRCARHLGRRDRLRSARRQRLWLRSGVSGPGAQLHVGRAGARGKKSPEPSRSSPARIGRRAAAKQTLVARSEVTPIRIYTPRSLPQRARAKCHADYFSMPIEPPPLSLYIHLPWCVRKCPYCDFNSHAAEDEVPERRYVEAVLRDLALDAPLAEGRTVETLFLGGGTPSLFSPESVARLLDGVRALVPLASGAEITLEANPGTVELGRFRGFRDAGVNRLSIGVQSFDDDKLKALGRIHGRAEALAAAGAARTAGFDNFNLDLMYGLPGQSVEQARVDIVTAIALQPTHISAYQLTLEPNTLFHQHPPTLPDDDVIGAMQDVLVDELQRRGYRQYEVSAYAQDGHQCRHNRNYWEFGD